MRYKFMRVSSEFIACVMRILMWQTTSLCLQLDISYCHLPLSPPLRLALALSECVMKIFTFDSGRNQVNNHKWI